MRKLEISRVHDAYARGGECPLCDLVAEAETAYLRSFEHSRVMEPEVRVRTNREGFCAPHLRRLHAADNKLGLGLMVHTRLQLVRAQLEPELANAASAHGRREPIRQAAAAASRIRDLGSTCYLCRLLEQDRRRYIVTILYLWAHDPLFAPVFRASRGFCLPHFAEVLDEAGGSMKADRLRRWLDDAGTLLRESLSRIEDDLLAFTQLHRAENSSRGTEEVRAALGRALQKLSGVTRA